LAKAIGMPVEKKATTRAGDSRGKLKELEALLNRRNSKAGNPAAVDREINRRFGCRRAVMVLDMSGFSLSTQRQGIIHHLAKIQRMRGIVSSEARAANGSVLKFEADNAYGVFLNVNAAVRASRGINLRIREANLTTEQPDHIHVSIGIGYGSILLARDDYFGDEVNLASKLGEDTADAGEVLLTDKAVAALRGKSHQVERFDLSISGIHLPAARLVLD
jgi:adenylate cyclase